MRVQKMTEVVRTNLDHGTFEELDEIKKNNKRLMITCCLVAIPCIFKAPVSISIVLLSALAGAATKHRDSKGS